MESEANKKMRVALIAGGKSNEREVSLSGADSVEQALDKNKYDVVRYDSATDLLKIATEADNIDFALIILHGKYGEDGTIQGFLEMLDIPYQGAGVLGSALAMDKFLSKQLYRKAGLPVADCVLLNNGDQFNSSQLVSELGLPLVTKPACEGSSVGVTIVKTESELEEGIAFARKYTGKGVMIEQFIDGREFACGVLGNDQPEGLPVLEIIPGDGHTFFDYEAKYQPGASEEICPAQIDAEIAEKIQLYAVKAHEVLQLRGYSRTDFLMKKDGSLYVLETNTIPGMTATSIYPQEAAAIGMSFTVLLDRLIELGLERV